MLDNVATVRIICRCLSNCSFICLFVYFVVSLLVSLFLFLFVYWFFLLVCGYSVGQFPPKGGRALTLTATAEGQSECGLF